jgi:hypothetical protein
MGDATEMRQQLLEYRRAKTTAMKHRVYYFYKLGLALAAAATYGRPTCVALLLEFGAEVDACDSSGNTALLLAARYAKAKAERLAYLESFGLSARDGALEARAVMDAQQECVKLLLAHGADKSPPDAPSTLKTWALAKPGKTPGSVAAADTGTTAVAVCC